MPKNIIFYFPYDKGAGGVNILFLRLADFLAEMSNYTVFLGDFDSGYMVTHNKNPKIGELRIVPDKMLDVPDDSIVIFQTISPWYIEDELHFRGDTKVLFWNLHPYNLLAYFRNYRKNIPRVFRLASPYVQHLIKKFVSIALSYRGLIFMDGENLRSAEYVIGKPIDRPFFVPVASETSKRLPFKSGNTFAWLGRLADFKVSILQHTMKKLSAYADSKKFKIKFDIIGDGPERSQIEQTAAGCEHSFFEICFTGEINHTQMEEYLKDNVNVLFAMGASALDGARLGLPTVLLDFSYQSLMLEYRYRYLFETEEYNLGREISGQKYKAIGRELTLLVDELRHDETYQAISSKCFQYYKDHHDVQSVSRKLLEAIEQCELRYEHIEALRHNKIMSTFKSVRRWMRGDGEELRSI